jgi:hypothetical protein
VVRLFRGIRIEGFYFSIRGVRFSNLTQLGSQTQESEEFENPNVSDLRI